MSEEKNIPPEEISEQPVNKPSDETTSSAEPVTQTDQLITHHSELITNDMEVHQHTHPGHHKKTWKDYFWEFLMLFLAVFCGFLAEYQLEHVIENRREKQYMTTLIEDLKDDVGLAKEQLAVHTQRITQNDSLIELLCSPYPEQVNSKELYYLARIGNRTIFFYNNDRTIEQMKYSGGLRLIRNKDVSNQIMSYYREIEILKMIESYDAEEQSGYKDYAVKIFDPVVFKNMSGNIIIQRLNSHPKLLTYNTILLKEFAGKVQYLNGSRIRQSQLKNDIIKSALSLIIFIKKEYHLE
ncbi:MAG: hypothetical protein ABIW38_01090 [Ferruginibacter sp.]